MSEIFVLDQNVLQRAGLPEFIAAHPDAGFAIPDTGLVEMVKSEKWEYTFKRNFEHLLPVVDRCFMTCSVQEAIAMERESHRSSKDELLPPEFTEILRGAIVGDGVTMQLLRAQMD